MLRRQSICELAKMFNAKVLDISLEHLMIELAAKSSRVDAFLELLRPFGIIESARSGKFMTVLVQGPQELLIELKTL